MNRVALVQSNPVWGATEKEYLLPLANGLIAKKWRVALIYPASAVFGVMEAELRPEIHRIRIDPEIVASIRGVPQLAGILRSISPDIAHCNDPGLIAMLAIMMARISKRVVTFHTPSHRFTYRLHASRLQRWSLRRQWNVIVVSRTNAATAIRKYCLKESMVHVVETGMDPARFSIADNRQKLRGKFGIKEDECVFACVARLAAQKNHSLLLRAYAELQKHTPRSRLLLVGDGELREELEVEARRLGLVGSVLFLGFSQNVPSILRASDVFVLSSHYEGLPYAVLEAMASGLPVVSTAVDGVIDAIVEGVTGHLVPRDDVMALARAMWQMILHPESRQLMGEAGRKRFRSRFTVEHMVEETVRLYGTIISPIKL